MSSEASSEASSAARRRIGNGTLFTGNRDSKIYMVLNARTTPNGTTNIYDLHELSSKGLLIDRTNPTIQDITESDLYNDYSKFNRSTSPRSTSPHGGKSKRGTKRRNKKRKSARRNKSRKYY